MKERKDKKKEIRHQKRKEYLSFKRKGKKFYSEKLSGILEHKRRVFDKILEKRRPSIITFLEEKVDLESIGVSVKIEFPDTFSLSKNYEESIKYIYKAIYSYQYYNNDKIILSFKKCKTIEVCCLFILDRSLEDIFSYNRKLQKKVGYDLLNEVEIIESLNEKANKKLVFLENKFLSKDFINDLKLIPIFKFLSEGSKRKKSYHENKKSITKKKIGEFLNERMISSTDYELSEKGVNHFESIIGEIIDNSEQHSYFKGNWFVGVLFYEDLDKEIGEKVLETQLHFLNFGTTIFESFEKTKSKNYDQYMVIENIVKEILTNTKAFTTENLFTLMSLNQSVSSKYYEEQARGTGTINFLNSFFSIGDYVDEGRSLYPEMIILSGKTLIRIDTVFKPYINDNGKYNISLNKENKINLPPEKTHLKNLKEFFPGTLISMRVYLNRNHLKNKINNEK